MFKDAGAVRNPGKDLYCVIHFRKPPPETSNDSVLKIIKFTVCLTQYMDQLSQDVLFVIKKGAYKFSASCRNA